MDPDATLERIEDAVISQDLAESDSACEDLRSWLAIGGFAPDWERYPIGTKRYQKTAERLDSGSELVSW